jgi:hypothetical protein
MITLFRLASFPLRWLLALLLALPTSFALYQIVQPRSMVDIQFQLIDDAMQQLQRLATAMGAAAPTTSRPLLDWGLIIMMGALAFTVYSALLHGWRALPLVLILAVPVFEGMRYYRPPVTYTAETAQLWWTVQLLTAPLVIVFVVVVAGWRTLVYGQMLSRIGWRWTAATAGMAMLLIAALRFFTPVRAIYQIETCAYPGSAWLTTLMLSWGGLAWLAWKLKRKPAQQAMPAPERKKDELTFEEAYTRVRAKHG